MKKVLFTLAVLMTALMAKADFPATVYMVGDGTPAGWELGNAISLTHAGDGVYTWEGTLKKGEIKLTKTNSSWDTGYIPSSWNEYGNKDIVLAHAHGLMDRGSEGDHKFYCLKEGSYQVRLDLKNNTFAAYPQKLYAVGPATDAVWSPENGVKIESTGIGQYAGTLNIGSGEMKFNFQKSWGWQFGPTVGGTSMAGVGIYDINFSDGGDDRKWNASMAGSYWVEIDLIAGKIKVGQLYLIGDPIASFGNFWNADNTSAPITLNYGEYGKYYIDAQLDNNKHFALTDGHRRYAPSVSNDINTGDDAKQGDYDAAHQDNSWKYVGNSTTRRICVDLTNPANPYMWIESQKMYVIGNPIDGDNTWGADAANKRELSHWDGNLAYVDCYMTKDSYFALSDGSKRYNAATQHQDPATATVGAYASADNDNSWKYVGNTGLVHLVIDKSNGSKFPTVQVTRPEVLLRHPWDGETWSQSEAMTDNGDGTYTLVKAFSGRADGYSVYTSYEGQHMNGDRLTTVGNLAKGDKCQFYVVTDKANGAAWHTTVTKYQTVSYDGNGKTSGDVPASVEVLHGENVTIAGQGNLARTGYTFAGWNTKTDGQGDDVAAGERALETTMTLYAKWEPITYTLTLNGNGGSDGAGSIVFDAKTATITTAPEQAGKFLSGYYAEGAATTHVMNADGSLVASVAGYTNADGEWIKAENTTLYAGWASAGTLTVSAGEHGSVITPDGAHQYTDVLLQGYAIEAKADEGYVFSGWTASPAENITFADATAAATTATVTTQSNITVTASFRAINYTVSFDKNGGEGEQMAPESFTYTEEKVFTTNAYTRTGYDFKGWATAADGEVVYADGVEVSRLTTTDNDEVKLFAVWACKYVLRGSLNDGHDTQGGMPGWSTVVSEMVPAEGVLAQQVLTLEAQKEYKFKFNIVEGDHWIGQSGNSHIDDDVELTLTGGDDIYLKTTITGDYTFQIVRLDEGKPVVKVLFADHGVQYTIYTGATTQSAGLGTVEVHVGEQVLHNGDTFNPGADLTFVGTAADGYYLNGWSWNSDETSLAGGWDGRLGNAIEDAKAYAIFRPRYTICGSLNETNDPKGGMPGWGKDAIEDFVVNGKTFSKTYTLEADKEYKFKLYDYARNDKWLGQIGLGGKIHADEKWTLDGGNDILFTTGAAGEYTFVIDFSGNVETPSISIIYPDERTFAQSLNKDGFASIYMPYNFTLPAGVEAYKGVLDDEAIVLTPVEQKVLPAETGLILYSASLKNQEITLTESYKEADAISENAFIGTLEDKEVSDFYVLAEVQNQTAFYYISGKLTIPAYRAYLKVAGQTAPLRIRFAGSTATELSEQAAATAGRLVLVGERVYVMRGNKVFTLDGRLVR